MLILEYISTQTQEKCLLITAIIFIILEHIMPYCVPIAFLGGITLESRICYVDIYRDQFSHHLLKYWEINQEVYTENTKRWLQEI